MDRTDTLKEIGKQIQSVKEYNNSTSYWGVYQNIRFRCNDHIVTANGMVIGEATSKVEMCVVIFNYLKDREDVGR